MNWYLEALRNSFNFSGRARRREYWWFHLLGAVAPCIVSFIALLLVMSHHFVVGGLLSAVTLVFLLAMLPASWSVAFRRLHDTGHSAWWLLIALVPFVGSFVFLILMLLDSEPGSNQYGPNPKR